MTNLENAINYCKTAAANEKNINLADKYRRVANRMIIVQANGADVIESIRFSAEDNVGSVSGEIYAKVLEILMA